MKPYPTSTWNLLFGIAKPVVSSIGLIVSSALTGFAQAPQADPGSATRAYQQAAEAIVARIQLPERKETLYHPRDFGAVADGRTDDRKALQDTIDRCSREGGGKVLLAAKTYFSAGPLQLKSGVELHLPEGGHLRFSGQPEDFLPPVLGRWEGTLVFAHAPMIYALFATDIALTGKGIIDGNAAETFAGWRGLHKNDQAMLREMGEREHPLYNRVMGGGHYLRPPLVHFFSCQRVLIEGLTFKDSPFWMIHPTFSEHLTIRGITCDSRRLNNDGVDPDSCRYVLIEDSTFNVGDDAVAIKSGRDREGRQLGVPSKKIVVRNNHFEVVHNGMAIGSEMSGGVRDIYLYNCKIGKGRSLLYFKSNPDRGGYIENIYAWDIEAQTATVALIRFQTDYHSHRGGRHFPEVHHFRLENIRAAKAERFGIKIDGSREAPMKDIHLRSIYIDEATAPVHVNPWDEVTFEDVYINGKEVQPKSLSKEEVDAVFGSTGRG